MDALEWDAPSGEIWAIVSGFPRSRMERQTLVALRLRTYVDDSEVSRGPVHVLAGWVAPARNWADFSNDWDDVLRMSPRIEYFKFSEAMGFNGEFNGISKESRDLKLKLLMQVIEKHSLFGVSSIIFKDVFDAWFGDDQVHGNPYFMLFYALVANVVRHAPADISEKIEFIFDNQPGQERIIRENWDSFINRIPEEYRGRIAGSPIFRDDRDILPLQAADLHAGYRRMLNASDYRGVGEPFRVLRI